MIHTIRTVAVGDQESKIDSPIILYRGDREVEVEFTINGSKFTFTNGGNVIKSTNATHGQLVINTPTGENMFSEVTECHDGKVVFVITKEMIDELIEVGFYSFQIRLFDESQVSRVTIPPVLKGIDIRNPIAAEDETNVVDIALVDYSVIVKDEFEDLSTFLPDGNYNKTEWESKDIISGAKLNKIEDALYNINSNMEATDLALLNRVENINKTIHGEIDKLAVELENEVEEFERDLNNNVERFKNDFEVEIQNDMNSIKNEFSDLLQSDKINVKIFGAKGDGVTDDTLAIKEAIAYAQTHPSKTIFLPKTSMSYRITDTINFYRMNVECRGRISIDFNGVGVIAGSSSNLGGENYNFYFDSIAHTNFIDGDISLRIQGAKCCAYHLGTMSKLQLYANSDSNITSSVAYNNIHLLGSINTIELYGEPNTSLSWINENTFYKGRTQNILFNGEYPHNKNVFFDTCVEGGRIILNTGTCNKFLNIRDENFKELYFAPNTHHNFFEATYFSAQGVPGSIEQVCNDRGICNVIVDAETPLEKVELIDLNHLSYNNYACVYKSSPNVINGQLEYAPWEGILSFDIPLGIFSYIDIISKSDKGIRSLVSTLDADKNIILESSGHIAAVGTTFNSSTGKRGPSVNTNANTHYVPRVFGDGDAKYMRVELTAGNGSNCLVDRIIIIAYCKRDKLHELLLNKPL